MNSRQRRRHERGARVRDFAETVKSSFPAGSKGAASAARVAELVGRVAELDASRTGNVRAAHEGASGKSEANAALRALLSQISRTARAISIEDSTLKDKFQLPGDTPNMQLVVSTARSFLAEAGPLKARFVEYGMGSDFLERLGALIADFESHAARRNTGASQRASDGAAIDSTLDELDEEITRFDAIAQNTFATDPAALAALRAARRLERAPRRAGATTPAKPNNNAPAA